MTSMIMTTQKNDDHHGDDTNKNKKNGADTVQNIPQRAETASTNYWQYIFCQNFADHQILIRNYHLENYQAAIIINDAFCISVKYYQK